MSDEVYEHIVFDGVRHESMARHPAIAERAVVISSFGKTYHTTGWKIGYCAAPRALAAEVARVHQWVTYAVNTPIQRAYAEMVTQDPMSTDVTSFYQAKRDLFLALAAGFAVSSHRMPRDVLSGRGLLGDYGRARRGVCDSTDEGARCRRDTNFPVPVGRRTWSGSSLLLCQTG